MKTSNLLWLGIFATMCTSCVGFGTGLEGEAYKHNVLLSFVDAEGNDLVEGIKNAGPVDSPEKNLVDTETYTLTVSPTPFELGFTIPSGAILDDPDPSPELRVTVPQNTDGVYYSLFIKMTSSRKRAPKTITYTLTCPYVFGDDEAHEIITYWDNSSKGWGSNRQLQSSCWRVVVDGRETADPYHFVDRNLSLATIVLDR